MGPSATTGVPSRVQGKRESAQRSVEARSRQARAGEEARASAQATRRAAYRGGTQHTNSNTQTHTDLVWWQLNQSDRGIRLRSSPNESERTPLAPVSLELQTLARGGWWVREEVVGHRRSLWRGRRGGRTRVRATR